MRALWSNGSRRSLAAVAALWALAWSHACIAPDDTPVRIGAGREARAIVGGTVEPGFTGVGALGLIEGSSFTPFCTGTLLRDGWFLTAAHCLVEDGRVRSTDGTGFFVGADTRDLASGTMFHPDGFFVHVDYEPGDPTAGTPPQNDIALVRLRDGSPASVRYSINSGSLAGSEGIGVTWIGYGVSVPPRDGVGVRRRGDGHLAGIYWWHLTYEFEGQLPCSGDSGGPTFILDGAEHRVAGVISTADEGCDEGGTSTRVDSYAPWIMRTMGGDLVPTSCNLTGGDCGVLACWLIDEDRIRCAPSQGLRIGEECNSDSESWLAGLPCADGLACVNVSADPTDGRCFAFCRAGTCPEGQTCRLDLVPGVPGHGLCVTGGEPCDLIGRECDPGFACLPLPGDAGGICRPSADLGLGEACDPDDSTWDPAPCADGTICQGVSPFSDEGVCMQMCFEDGDCEGTDTCRAPIYSNVDRLGVCECVDFDRDGFCEDEDCDDENRNVNPGRDERCRDGLDNDCDGGVDEDCACTDSDADGFCAEDDCDDADPGTNPDAAEVCDDGADNDCDGAIDADDPTCEPGEGDPDGGPGDADPDDAGPGDADPDDGDPGDAEVDGDGRTSDGGACECEVAGAPRGLSRWLGVLGRLAALSGR